ncbi:unnamed protein product [Malus baccata var. baccata]
MAIKLDMAKAYDRVEWAFLLSMMAKLGFTPLFCNWIKKCISTASFSILVNRNPTGVEEARGILEVLRTYARGSGQAVRDRLESRLAGWAEQFLSQAGKEVLVKAVAMAMPNYAMSCFKLPIGVCRDLEKAIRDFWWRGSEQRKGVHWISWERLMKQKRFGGLGFRDIQCFNLAFLAKIGWRLVQNPGYLLANVLREKYYPGKSFTEVRKGRNTSWGWKDIFKPEKVLLQGLRWRVGDGACINIREDPWFPRPSTFRVMPLVNLQATLVSDLIDSGSSSWKSDLISASFHWDDVEPILSIPLSKTRCRDRMVWHHNVNGVYSVRSGYGVAMNLMENGALGKKGRGSASEKPKNCYAWNLIWKLKSEIHLFFRCHLSHLFWFSSLLQLNSFDLAGADFLASWEMFWSRVKGRENAEDIMQEFAFGLWRLTLRTGVGWVCRDFAGLLHGAGGSGVELCHSAAAGEAAAIRTALLACIDHGYDHVVIESDAKVIIQMIRHELAHDFSLECILGDIEVLVRRLRSVSFSYVPRESNVAAYSVAKFVFKEGREFGWDCIGPEFLFNILAQDVNLSIRYLIYFYLRGKKKN